LLSSGFLGRWFFLPFKGRRNFFFASFRVICPSLLICVYTPPPRSPQPPQPLYPSPPNIHPPTKAVLRNLYINAVATRRASVRNVSLRPLFASSFCASRTPPFCSFLTVPPSLRSWHVFTTFSLLSAHPLSRLTPSLRLPPSAVAPARLELICFEFTCAIFLAGGQFWGLIVHLPEFFCGNVCGVRSWSRTPR